MFGYASRSLSALLTAVYLLISTGACAVGQAEEIYSPAEGIPLVQQGPVAVNILQSAQQVSRPLQLATEQFRSPDQVVFHVQTVASREDYRSTLRSKLLAGDPVDLFHLLGADDVARLSADLEDLSTLPWVAQAAAGTLDTVMMGDAVYGVPYSLEGIGLVVNRRIFEAANIPLADIRDFESLADALYELRDQIDSGSLREAFPNLEAVADFAAQDTPYLADTAAELLLSSSFASPTDAYRSSTLTLPDTEAAESFFSLLARVSPHRADWTALASVSSARMVEDGIAAGRVAVILESTEIYRRVYAANPDMQGKLALLPVYLEEHEQGSVFAGAPAWWAVRASSDGAAKEAATGLLTWLYTTQEGGDVLASDFGVLSPYPKPAQSTDIALHRQLLDAVQRGEARPRLASEAPAGWGEEAFAVQLRQYFTLYAKEWPSLAEACVEQWAARR